MDILNNRLIKTELVEWKKLIPFQPDNLKKTEPHKLQKLANSLCQNGFSMNFYVWEKEGQILIIDGHSRHEVLQLLESGAIYPKNPDGKEYAVTIPEKLPCSFLHLKNKTEAKKAVLIYNSKYKNIDSDILAEWVSDLNLDELKSQIEIPELKLGFDIPQELENDSIDDAAKIKTDIKLGDLIEIGRHRLLCGDSTKKEDVERLMNGNKADMVLTDPPYNVKFAGRKRKDGYRHKVIKNDDLSGKDFDDFISAFMSVFLINKPNEVYMFCDWKLSLILAKHYDFKQCLCVIKNHIGMGRGYRKQTELCLYNGSFESNEKNDILLFTKEMVYSTKYKVPVFETLHPTQKPIELICELINNSSKESEIILDYFLGSGSTMVACQTLDRTCYGMELEPLYIQVIINRMRKNFPELEIKVNGKEYTES